MDVVDGVDVVDGGLEAGGLGNAAGTPRLRGELVTGYLWGGWGGR